MKAFIGEGIGTFVLTLFGCGSVAVAILFGEYSGIFQVGLIWGVAVTLAIYLTRYLSCAHLNPAVTLAMVLSKRMEANKLLPYMAAQLLGAFAAGLVLYLLFAPSIAAYESAHQIVRGTALSIPPACSVSFIPIRAIRERSFPCHSPCSPRALAPSCWSCLFSP